MIKYLLIIFIYGTFAIDFLIWPIPSEASTKSLIKKNNRLMALLLALVFILNIIFYLSPLLLTIYYFFKNSVELTSKGQFLIGFTLAITGRFTSLLGSHALRKSTDLVCTKSVFRFTRNPISLGMHLTIFGLLIIFNLWYLWIGFLLYLINIHYKILIEEKELLEKYRATYEEYYFFTPRYLLW
jgi:protein-S-isoprenylcysteine O-methyltransferase Ste14